MLLWKFKLSRVSESKCNAERSKQVASCALISRSALFAVQIQFSSSSIISHPFRFSNTTPPQRSLITLSAASKPMSPRFLRILTSLIPLPNTKLHHPRNTRQRHTSHSDPCQNQVFIASVSVNPYLVTVFIDDVACFRADYRDDDACYEQSEERECCQPPVSEGDEA